jgi:hypothetical protein
MYKIVFIDESQDELDTFLQAVRNSLNDDIEFKVCFPSDDLNDLVEKLFEEKYDAIITDFLLNDYKTDIDYNVPYDGVDLVNLIREKRDNFPCFVLTSRDYDAMSKDVDVNLIYEKRLLENDTNKFVERVYAQIQNLKKKLDKLNQEHEDLVELSKKCNLSAKDEDRLIEVDSILESYFDRKSSYAASLKEANVINELSEFIKKTDEMLKEMEEKKGR